MLHVLLWVLGTVVASILFGFLVSLPTMWDSWRERKRQAKADRQISEELAVLRCRYSGLLADLVSMETKNKALTRELETLRARNSIQGVSA